MNILCIEDNAELAEHMAQALRKHGHTATVCGDGQKGANLACSRHFDAVILDVGLPGCDGFEVARQIRAAGQTPWICMLTARSDLKDRISGLNAGADDYMAKPFSLDELVARVNALQRRTTMTGPSDDMLRVGDVVLDMKKGRVTRAGREVPLSPREFALLQILMREPGRVFARDEISERIWQRQHNYDSRTVEVYMGRLRRKLEDGHTAPILQTLRGEGYCIQPA